MPVTKKAKAAPKLKAAPKTTLKKAKTAAKTTKSTKATPKTTKKPQGNVQNISQMSLGVHARQRGMWAGGHNITTGTSMRIVDGKFTRVDETHCLIAEQLTREQIGNALDQARRCGTTSCIFVGYDRKSGCVIIINDGNGFDLVTDFKTIEGQVMPNPQACATVFGVGGSFETDDDGIGTNGMGLKISVANSAYTCLDTIDCRKNKKPLTYRQEFHGVNETTQCYNVDKPQRDLPTDEFNKLIHNGGTHIVLQYDWEHFGLSNMHKDARGKTPGTTVNNPDAIDATEDITRAFESAIVEMATIAQLYNAFLCKVDKSRSTRVSIMHNIATAESEISPRAGAKIDRDDVRVVDTTLDRILALDGQFVVGHTTIKPTGKSNQGESDYPWEFFAGLSTHAMAKRRSGTWERLGIVNGVRMDEGSITEYIIVQFMEHVIANLKKLKITCTNADIRRYFRIGVISCVGDISNDSQSKNRVSEPKSRWAAHVVPKEALKRFWNLTGDTFVELTQTRAVTKRAKLKFNFADATSIGKRAKAGAPKKRLFLAEGMSALGVLLRWLGMSNVPDVTREYSAGFAINGVPLNSWNDAIYTAAGTLPGKRTEATIKLNQLRQILGLEYGKNNTPRYDCVVLLVDQDTDGFGKIIELIWLYFWTYWRDMIEARPDFLQWLQTPVMRVYAKGAKRTKSGPPKPLKVFYDLPEAKAWMDTRNASSKPIDVYYYKGLGAHEEDMGEVSSLAQNLDSKLRPITCDVLSDETVQVFYGADTDARKALLARTPYSEQEIIDMIHSAEESHDDTAVRYPATIKSKAKRAIVSGISRIGKYDNEMSITMIMYIYRMLYMRDSLRRTIPGMDGLVESRRKAVHTLQKNLNYHGKVYIWGGMVGSATLYGHGNESLYDVLTKMMTRGLDTGNQACMMLPHGSVGTISFGYSNAASARYLGGCAHKALLGALLPAPDSAVVDYEFEGDTRLEPKQFYPTMPWLMFNSIRGIACAWSCNIHPRTIDSIWARLCWYLDNGIDSVDKARAATTRGTRGDWLHTVGKKTAGKPTAAKSTAKTPPVLKSKRRKAPVKTKQVEESKQVESRKTAGPPPLLPFETRVGAPMIRDGNKVYMCCDYKIAPGAEKSTITITQFHEKYTPTGFADKFNDPKYEKVVVSCIDSTERTPNVVVVVNNLELAKACKIKYDGTVESLDRMAMKYFTMRALYNPLLHVLDINNNVIVFADYEEMFDRWYMERYDCYLRRFERRRIIIALRLELLRQRQLYTVHYTKMNGGKVKTATQLVGVIEKFNASTDAKKLPTDGPAAFYPMCIKYTTDSGAIDTPTLQLVDRARGKEASYSFLLDMTINSMSDEQWKERQKQIDNLKDELDALNSANVMTEVWKREAGKVHEVAKDALDLALSL